MRIAIIDDDEYQVHEVEERINCLYQNIFLIDGYHKARDLLVAFEYDQYDLVYLDFELNDMNSIDLAKQLKKIYDDVEIIFMITHMNDYRSFKLDDFQFIEKPINNESFNMKLNHAIKHYQLLKRRITLKTHRGTYVIPVNKIVLIETSYKEYKLHTVDKVYYGPVKHVRELREKLCNDNFMRVHRSYMINFEHVVKYEPHEVYMVNGATVPIARSKAKEFKQSIKQFVNK